MDEKPEGIGTDILAFCRNELYMSMPYLAEALFALEFSPGDGITVTAATDGQKLYYSENFLKDIFLRNEVKPVRLYLHTVLHCMLRHLWKRKGRDAVLWDLACDAAVENIIDSLPYSVLSCPSDASRRIFYGRCLEEMKVLTAEGIYRMLLAQRPDGYEIARLQREFLGDDHGLWDTEKEKNDESPEQSWKNISSRTKTAMETALSREARGGETVLESLRIETRDDIDYRAFLRRFASPREIMRCDDDAFDYIYYTYGLRHYGNMPLIETPETREDKRIEDFVIAVDTSMSTSGELVREFLRCTYSILMSTETFTRKLNIRIIQCDDRVRSEAEIRDTDGLKKYMEDFRLTGGSATDFRPVFNRVDELKAEGAFTSLRGIIYFTDGMGIYPEKRPDYDAAFILLEEPPLEYAMPPWCVRIMLGITGLEKAVRDVQDLFDDDTKEEMPEL